MVEGHLPTRATLNKPIFILFLKSVGTVYTSYLHSTSPFCYDRVTLQARPTFLCINTLVKARQSEHAHGLLEWFSFECRKTKTKVITLANHIGHRQYIEPIKTRSNYMWLTQSAGKCMRARHNWLWFYF